MLSNDGNPFVPPDCPAALVGAIPDLSRAQFGLWYIDGVTDETGGETGTLMGIAADFSYPRPDEDGGVPPGAGSVEVGPVRARTDSPLAHAIRALVPEETPGYGRIDGEESGHPVVEAIRRALCDRVARCAGLTASGACSALGAVAFRQVLDECLGLS